MSADASVEALESSQMSLEISLLPTTALMSFAELPDGVGIPRSRAPRALGRLQLEVQRPTQEEEVGLANQAAPTSCTSLL